jgi:MFS family permease
VQAVPGAGAVAIWFGGPGAVMSDPRMYTKPFVLTTLAFFCFFTNVNAYNLLPLHLHALGAQAGEIGTIMAMFSVAAILAQAITGRLLDRGWRPSASAGSSTSSGSCKGWDLPST